MYNINYCEQRQSPRRDVDGSHKICAGELYIFCVIDFIVLYIRWLRAFAIHSAANARFDSSVYHFFHFNRSLLYYYIGRRKQQPSVVGMFAKSGCYKKKKRTETCLYKFIKPVHRTFWNRIILVFYATIYCAIADEEYFLINIWT